jgi:hypothetical protein
MLYIQEFITACEENQVELARVCFVTVDTQNGCYHDDCSYALLDACQSGRIGIVEVFIEDGRITPNMVCFEMALINGHNEIAQLLAKNGVNIFKGYGNYVKLSLDNWKNSEFPVTLNTFHKLLKQLDIESCIGSTSSLYHTSLI